MQQINFINYILLMFYFSVIFTDAKAAEAAQSAYYDPSRPQCAYVPPPAYYVSNLELLF